jgi:sortase A
MTLSRPHLRRLAVLLVIAGGALLGVYIVPTVYGAAMSEVEIARFRAESASHREWDPARILAYKRSLRVKFELPEAILSIPSVDLEVPVLEGVDELTMNRGAGHIPGTALPGEHGNVGIAGHRDGFFRVLKDVHLGDVVVVERSDATDRYVVEAIDIVDPSDTSDLKFTTASTLTLVTCYPFHFVGSAPQRYVVRAALVSTTPSTAPHPSGD